MKQRQTTRGRRGHEGATDVEWIGAVAPMPAYVTGEGEPYRPEMLVWMGADGAVLGATVMKPGELLPLAGESLRTTIEQPIYGPPHTPTRVRVASPELADAVRASHPKLDIICAPTPEIDEFLALMREKIGEDLEEERSYLSPEIAPEAMASFFGSAADLFRAKPWKVVPDDQSLMSVTIEQLGVRDAAISVIGQMGQSFGLILFSSLDDFEAYLEAADLIESGAAPKMPRHFALNFERGADLPPVLRKEIAAHGWQVAGRNAYPWLIAIDEDLVARPPTGREVTMAEAIARAVTMVLAEKKKLRAAWRGGEPVSRRIPVRTHAGDIAVSLCAPYQRAPADLALVSDLLAKLDVLTDIDAREPLEEELLRRFVASPEAQDLSHLHACGFVMDFAANYFGVTVARLGPTELREILFAIVPRKLSVDASAARWIIEELRAFYCYLKREHGLAQADSCLKVLGDGAIEKLEAALGDSTNFGVAKSLLMTARDAGVDLDSSEGIEAWLQSIQGKPLPPSVALPSAVQLPLLGLSPLASKPVPKKAKRKSVRKGKK